MTNLLYPIQDFYKQVLSSASGAGAGNIYVDVKPTNASGLKVISPSNFSLREIVRYSATGTDVNGDYIVISSTSDRGLGGTTAQTHNPQEAIRDNFTSLHWNQLDAYIYGLQGALVAGGVPATSSVLGISKLSLAPVTPSIPIAVGDNDPRMPTQAENDAMAGTGGVVGSGNRFITEQDATGVFVKTGASFNYTPKITPAGYLRTDKSNQVRATYPNLFSNLNPSSVVTISIANPAVISQSAHGYSAGDRVAFKTSGALPTGLAVSTYYFVIAAGLTTNTFQISDQGGAGLPIQTSGSQSGVHTIYQSRYGLGDFTTTFDLPLQLNPGQVVPTSFSSDFGTANAGRWLSYTTNNMGITGGNITVDFWMKVNTEITASSYGLWQLGDATTSYVGYLMTYNYNGGARNVTFERLKNGATDDNGTYAISLGTTLWHHFVLVYDGTNVTGYVDGALAMSAVPSSGNGTAPPAQGLFLGSVPRFATLYAPVKFSNFAIFNYAKTAGQIANDHATPTTLLGNEKGLVAYYNFSKASNDILSDQGPNGYNLSNTPNANIYVVPSQDIPTMASIAQSPSYNIIKT
jgi:hypothetical protein